jgi:hypothetical protein
VKQQYVTERVFKRVNREKLLTLSTEKLVDMLVDADNYTNDHEGFHVLIDKYLVYKTVRRKVGNGKPITREDFEKSFAVIHNEVFKNAFDTSGVFKL